MEIFYMDDLTPEQIEAAAKKKAEEKKSDEKPSDTVSREHYNKAQQDMMRYKAEKKELKEQLEARDAKDLIDKNAAHVKNAEWKELADSRDTELKKLQSERAKEHEDYVNNHKRLSVVGQIGKFENDRYMNMSINLDNILMVDGVIDQASLDTECARIKKVDGKLLLKGFTPNLPGAAPDTDKGGVDIKYSDMSPEQKNAARHEAMLANNKK